MSVRDLPEATLRENRRALERQMYDIDAELKRQASLTPAARLATVIHEKMCHFNHTDACSWEYEKNWTDYTHAKYLAKAEKALAATGNDEDMVLAMMDALR